jgi:O-antigen/teichoic acid export membrane protein
MRAGVGEGPSGFGGDALGAPAAPAASGAPSSLALGTGRARSAGATTRAASLRTNFAWTLAGTVVYAGCQWGILVVLAKLTSPEAVGQFALGAAVTAPVFLFTGLQLRASQATDTVRGFPFADYLGVRAGGMIVGLIVTALLAWGSGYDRATLLVILVVGASKAVEGMSDVYYGAMQHRERMRPIAISLMARGILALAAAGAALRMGGGVLGAVAAIAVSWAAVLLVHDVPMAAPFAYAPGRRRPSRERWRSVRTLVMTCLPLGLCTMLVSLRVNVPRYFIRDQLGSAELGVFAALSSLLAAGNLVLAALGQSATPRMARYHELRDVRAFRRLVARLTVIAALVGAAGLAVALLAGEPLLRFVFGPRYAGRADLLVWLMAAGLVMYVTSPLGYALVATRRFAVQVPLFAVTTLLCAGVSWSLVPAYGLLGAACALGGSFLVEVGVIWLLLELAIRARPGKGET